MHNTSYVDLKKRLKIACACPFFENTDVRVYRAVLDYTDVVVLQDSTVESIGHVVISRLLQEGSPSNHVWSMGLQRIGSEIFDWAILHQDWRNAAWLLTMPFLNIPLPPHQHPRCEILHALVCNDSTDWPTLYTLALTDSGLVSRAIDFDAHACCEEKDSLHASTKKHFSQIRKGCYFGPGHGMLAISIACTWLSLHDGFPHSDTLPERMSLRHIHPEQENLTCLLQNQWCANQFWALGETAYLDAIADIGKSDFQSWFWLLSAKQYTRYEDLVNKVSVWDQWWSINHSTVVDNAFHWLNLHTQVNSLDALTARKKDRLLIVRDSLALEQLRPDACFELPKEYQEAQ